MCNPSVIEAVDARSYYQPGEYVHDVVMNGTHVYVMAENNVQAITRAMHNEHVMTAHIESVRMIRT
jgi:hypothetical protein